ncbi:hypothetical protein [Rhodococcus opacus]|uniref:hypothetical protein n=1 Tax=Rhodococcus opacus TaxID=37919 RepID=UPI0022365C88|nr:hypothetical protein [Rhodococcus opacus]UZG59903.1 hypothetical protein ONE62_39945 [Rhodococcus opacus]
MPSETELTVLREQVTGEELEELGVELDRDFPGATVDEFRRYPVLSEGGWYMVVKHQPSLTSVSRETWKPLGPVSLTSEGLVV